MRNISAILFFILTLWSAVVAETIQIDGPSGPLSAEMLIADGAGHAVVIIPGSGPTDRNGNESQHYRMLAEELAAKGVASIRIDKRGMFGSAKAIPDPNDVTIAEYAQDARDWVERAAALAPCVWIAGHSEGGLVALVAATMPPERLCGLILLAAPGRPLGQVLREQLKSNPANAALLPEINEVITELEAGRQRDLVSISPVLHVLFNAAIQPYWIDLLSHDPAVIARQWNGPALVVQGDADIQVKWLDAELLATGLPNGKLVNLSGATHTLKVDVPREPLVTYTDPTLPLHPELVPEIMKFLDLNQPQ